MKKTLASIFISIILILQSHIIYARPATDGYTFSEKQFEHLDIRVKVILFKSKKEWKQHLQSQHFNDMEIFGYAIISPNKNTCDIYMIDPKTSYQPDAIGHEFLHCLFGQFHRTQTGSNITLFTNSH